MADSCNGDSGGGLTATNFNGREVGFVISLTLALVGHAQSRKKVDI